MHHSALELLKIFNFDSEQLGCTLALCSRAQGSSVPSTLTSLRGSAEDGSSQAKSVLASFETADSVLKGMAAEVRAARSSQT
jgi:hypothetical protein